MDLAADNFTQRINQERGYQQSFLHFAAYCGKTGSCPLPADANQAIHVYHVLLCKLHDHPFITQAGYEISTDYMVTMTRTLLTWPDRWHELAVVLQQINTGIASRQLSNLVDKSYSPDAEDALNVITYADVANPGSKPQLRRQRQEINTTAMYAHYLPLREYPLEIYDLWPYPGKLHPHVPVVSPTLLPLLFVGQRYDPATPYAYDHPRAGRTYASPEGGRPLCGWERSRLSAGTEKAPA